MHQSVALQKKINTLLKNEHRKNKKASTKQIARTTRFLVIRQRFRRGYFRLESDKICVDSFRPCGNKFAVRDLFKKANQKSVVERTCAAMRFFEKYEFGFCVFVFRYKRAGWLFETNGNVLLEQRNGLKSLTFITVGERKRCLRL